MGSMLPIHPLFIWLVFNEVQFRSVSFKIPISNYVLKDKDKTKDKDKDKDKDILRTPSKAFETFDQSDEET